MLNVFTYWENDPNKKKMKYIDICLDSIRFHCLDGCLFHHVTSKNISKYIPDGVLNPEWKKIKQLGVKSDCVRAACLFLYGGMYIDADTMMLKSPKHLDTGADFGGSVWTVPPRRVIAGYCYCAKRSRVAKAWVNNINANLEKGIIGWCELGEGCLTSSIDDSCVVDVWPISTFLPVEIDTSVHKLFEDGDPAECIDDSTVAFGLNNSWMTRRKTMEMMIAGADALKLKARRASSTKLIHRVMEFGESKINRMSIGVCVPTFRRPELLGHLIECFSQQEYKNAELIAYDDCGEINEASGDGWTIVSRNERHASLGEKRNAIARMMPEKDVYVFWDDDEILLPHALTAIEHALSRADFARASQVYTTQGRNLVRTKTYYRRDAEDKAFQCSWGITRSAFECVGGYDSVSLGEDLVLAKKLRDAGISESDPIELGWKPFLVASPYSNTHFSWNCKDYEEWNRVTEKAAVDVIVRPHEFKFTQFGETVIDRPWSGDWYEDEVR